MPPEDPDDHGQRERKGYNEGEYKKNNLTAKQHQQLEGKKLEGKNPRNVAPGNKWFTNVNTEKLGGLEEAKKIFEKLTGEKVPDYVKNPGDRHEVILYHVSWFHIEI